MSNNNDWDWLGEPSQESFSFSVSYNGGGMKTVDMSAPPINHFTMLIPAEVVNDGFTKHMSFYYFSSYELVYHRRRQEYLKKKGLMID